MAVSISRFLRCTSNLKYINLHSRKTSAFISSPSHQQLRSHRLVKLIKIRNNMVTHRLFKVQYPELPIIVFYVFSNESSGTNNDKQPIRLPDDALPAKDTASWQEGLDKKLPGIATANYIAKSTHTSSSEKETTKVSNKCN